MSDMQTNVIYLTTRCNLACTYCYQHITDYPHRDTTIDELKIIAEDTIKREGLEKQTFFSLFGGEPTTKWKNAKFFMDYAYSLKKNIQFNIITNGIKFLDNNFLRDFISNKHYKEGRLQVEISFDGQIGNKNRIYPDGRESTSDMLNILFKLKEINLKYILRYTIHKENIEYVDKDIHKIIKYFNPDRIVLNEYEEDLNEKEISYVETIKKKLIEEYYNNIIDTPICMKNNEMCSICGICEKSVDSFLLNIGKEKINKKHFEIGNFEDFKG